MSEAYWQAHLTGLEPTCFPDLTGKSASARSTLTHFHKAELELPLSKHASCSVSPSTFLTACAKVVALYLGESDFCIEYVLHRNNDPDSFRNSPVLPLHVIVEGDQSNDGVRSQIEKSLDERQKFGPPTDKIIEGLFESADDSLSNILVIVYDSDASDSRLLSEYMEKYDVIIEYIPNAAKDTDPSALLSMHFRSCFLLSNDTPHVLAVFRTAFVSVHLHPSTQFLSWESNSDLLLSVSNLEFTSVECQTEQTVHALFERHAVENPDQVALDFLEEDRTRTTWTFTTLDSIANVIANKLIQDYGVQVEDSVPICVSKSPAFYACVLAVLKAGGNFTPFAACPRERRKFMLEELESKVVLYTDTFDLSWASGVGRLDISPLITEVVNSNAVHELHARPAIKSSNLCYQMYTSGSTGRPKAVSLEHRNAVQTACATRDLVPWKHSSRLLQQAGVTFDMCYFETFFAWNTGICLCSAPDTLIYNDLTDVVNNMKVTLLGSTPSVTLTINPSDVPGVEWLYCIGEALPQALADTWEGRLVNSYGPTEAAQMVTLFPVNSETKSTIIGKPFANTSFTILRKNSTEIVPTLGLGELCIGGLQIARGYFKNPDKTAQAFIEFNKKKLYRTGDLVRMLSNGTFEFIGRIDDQVKVRGQRVELGEIDKTIERSYQTIQRASTQILKVNDRSKSQLVAFLVLDRRSDVKSHDDIRSQVNTHLADALPAYMVPKFYIFVDEIPLSPAGKVDRRALAQSFRESDQIVANQPQTTTSSTEDNTQVLKEVYSEFCGTPAEEIDQDASIYQLGIDSISAIQIAHKLREKAFQVHASDVLNYHTISGLSTFLGTHQRSYKHYDTEKPISFDYDSFDRQHRSTISGQYEISATKIAAIRPASPLQASMVAQSIHTSGSLYFNHLSYQLPDDLEVQRFEDAWNAVVSKHEILRSGFIHLDDSTFPLAMITYYARSLSLPVSHTFNESCDIESWQEAFVKAATQNIHLPPWQVLILPDKNRFCFSAHHALYDAQVLEIFIRDLALAYDGARLSVCPPIEPHLAKFLHGANEGSEEGCKFWQEYGKNAVSTKFPLLSPLFEEGNKLKVEVTRSNLSISELDVACRKSSITIQTAAQAAWGQLLGSITGEEVVTFGTVLGGRVAEGSEEVAYPMITTVPTIVDNSVTRSETLSALIDFNANVQRHQFVSLKKIQTCMGIRDKNMFDTLFTYQRRSHNVMSTRTKLPFLENKLTIEYPISLELEPTESGYLQLSVFYLSSYMHSDQARLIAEQFHFLLQNIILADETALRPTVVDADPSVFSIMPPKSTALSAEHSLLHHTVEIKTRDDPEKVALEFVTSLDVSEPKKTSWTFRELNTWGNRVAHFLRDNGVVQGDIVALCFDKCPEAAFVMLGISKAGCGFLALDPGAPIERKKFIMEDSRASMLLTNGGLAQELRSTFGTMVVSLTMRALSDCSSSSVNLDRPIDDQEACYCLYTSGTTGTPKGCIVTHENVIQVFCCFEKLYAYDDTSRWLQFASYHFDVSVMEHFWSWFVGITVVKAHRDLVLQDLANAISSLSITHIDLTPSLARLLDPKDVPTLAKGVFVTGGEMLRRDIVEAWGESRAIHNAYGPTEATIGVTMYPKVPRNGRPSNIGWPFDVVGIMVVNPSDPTLPVLRGGVGELIVSGKLVAKGYLRRDELTRERFIEVAGQRCYRTGDLVRVLSDGSIDFLGRADDQVKLRGQRLETGEINSIIKQRHEDIDDVLTLVLQHPKQQKEQLVSFVTVKDLGDKHIQLSLCQNDEAVRRIPDLRAACVEKLPGYMVPTHILMVNRMPLSANNKIEGKQLKHLYEGTDLNTMQSLTEVPKNSIQDSIEDQVVLDICQVLARSLKIDVASVLPSSSFFELGLDSISIINFSRSLKKAGYKEANPSVIMNNPTLQKLAIQLTGDTTQARDDSVQRALQLVNGYSHRYKALAASMLKVSYDDIEAIAPCTALQAGIISRTLKSAHGLYFAAFSFDLKKEIDESRLKESCQRVCDRVQILRTKFIPTDDGFIQVAMRQIEIPWSERSESSESHLEKALKEAHRIWWKANQQEIRRPFELVIVKTPTKSVLALHIFHALYDGNSLPLIMNAVIGEYQNDRNTIYGPSFFDALPYGPLREISGAERFWSEHLEALDGRLLAKVRPIEGNHAQKDTCVMHRIESIRGFEACRRNLNVTHQAILQACWTVILQDMMCGPLILGLIISGRSMDFEDVETVVGPIFNTIPFLLNLNRNDSWRSAIIKCHEFNTAALPYQHTPLRDIQRWTRKHRSKATLFESLFVFQKETASTTDIDPPWKQRDETFEADYPLAMEVEQTLDEGFNLTLACQAHISDERASKSLLERFENTLKQMIHDIDCPLTGTTSNLVRFEQQQSKHSSDDVGNVYSNGHGNGVSKGHGNDASNGKGVKHHDKTNGNGVVASKVAERVCEEIAALANVNSNDIHGDTSIFELGLDSIDAVKLSSRLKKATKTQLSVSQIMRLLTVNKIAAAIDGRGEASRSDTVLYNLSQTSERLKESLTRSGSDLTNVEKVLPCTPLQEAMIADMLNSDYEHYLNFDVLKLKEHTDITVLKQAWNTVVERFPILRTRFVSITDPQSESTFAQLIVRPSEVQFQEIQSTAETGFSAAFSDIREDVKSTFGIKPGLRLTLIQDPHDGIIKYFILTLPHAMYDGWSLGLVHDAVQRAYRNLSIEASTIEPALSSILGSVEGNSLQFWRQTLTNTVSTIIPSKRSYKRSVHRLERSSKVSLENIHNFCRQHRVTIAALCQTTWSVVLAHYTKQLDVSFAQVLSGRTDETTNKVVFPTMNTIISRAVIHGTRSSMVQYIQEGLSAVSEYQHFPLRKALALAASERNKEIFNSLFIFQKAADNDTSESTTNLYESVDSASNVEYPVCVEAEAAAHELIWRTACEETIFDKNETTGLLELLDKVLYAVISEPSKDVVQFDGDQVSLCDLVPISTPKRRGASEANGHINESVNGHVEDNEWSTAERSVREVIASVSKTDLYDIKKQSNLFGLGLDSISTIKVSSLLRKRGFQIKVNDILSAGSVEKIAQLCVSRDHDGDGTSLRGSQQHTLDKPDEEPKSSLLQHLDVESLLASHNLKAENVEEILPTTGGQMLLLSRWQNEGVYYSSLDFSIHGYSDIKKLRNAWTNLVQRLSMLRTVFLATGHHQTPVLQAVLREAQAQFIEVAASSSLDQKANQTNIEIPDLITPPCALYVQKVGDEHFDLALNISHALYDGFTIKMLISDFQDLVNDVPLQSIESAYTFSKYLTSTAASETKREFWSHYLKDLPMLQLPSSGHGETNETPKQIHMVKTDVLLNISSLQSFARQNQVSVQTLLIASYAVTHAQMLRQAHDQEQDIEDILIGMFMANRNVDGADELAAPTLGFAPVRIRYPLSRPLIEIAKDIQNDMREISEQGRGQVGLWELQEWIGDHIKVDVWINILRQWLPDTTSNQDTKKVQVVTGEKSQNLQKQYEITRCDEDIARGLLLKNNVVRGCYDYPMMDLEATVKDDNLDIGIQAPTTLFGFDRAGSIIDEVSARLNDLSKEI